MVYGYSCTQSDQRNKTLRVIASCNAPNPTMKRRPAIPNIEDFVKLIPEPSLDVSGSVFFSGRRAFSEPSDLYVLALNPAGDPRGPHTIKKNVDDVLHRHPDNCSAWRDERRSGRTLRHNYRQRRVLYLFDQTGRDPGAVPATEAIFLRSTNPYRLVDLESLAQDCWSFHEAVIRTLGVRVVVCLGGRAGRLARQRVNANEKVDEFIEDNRRRWKSRVHTNFQGLAIMTLTHPSRLDSAGDRFGQ